MIFPNYNSFKEIRKEFKPFEKIINEVEFPNLKDFEKIISDLKFKDNFNKKDSKDKLELNLELPGCIKEKFSVTITNEVLLIKSLKKDGVTNVEERISLKGVDIASISASYLDGILSVIVSKKIEPIKTFSVEVK